MKIGLLFNVNDEQRFWNKMNYIQWLDTLGNVTIIDPYSKKLKDVDLLVLPGGSDIAPSRYNQPWIKEIGLPNRAFEWFDTEMLPQYINAGKRVFGICR